MTKGIRRMTVTVPVHPEVALAESLSPRDYLLVRLNATAQNRTVLPAHEGWRINTKAQKVTK